MVTAEMKHIEEFYEAHPEVEPKGRWPSLLGIQVSYTSQLPYNSFLLCM